MTLPRIVVLGGYGLFGRHVCLGLATLGGFEVIVAGRSAAKAQALIDTIALTAVDTRWQAAALDHTSATFPRELAALDATLVIHCAGPFQAQDYAVARAAMACGTHYVDLSDSRTFVSGIGALDAQAKAQGVVVLSGASSVPAISSAVVTQLSTAWQQLESIDVGISPGNQTERGLATVSAILSYVGAPIPQWRKHQWRTVRGWLGLRSFRYPQPAGKRWLVDCDVPTFGEPDATRLQQQSLAGAALLNKESRTRASTATLTSVASVRFGAGLEHPVLHFGLYALAWLRRLRLLPNLVHFARFLRYASTWFQGKHAGTDVGAMHVSVSGLDANGQPATLIWTLVAEHGCGPHVPATPAVAFAARLRSGALGPPGARACVAELRLAEITALWRHLPISMAVSARGQAK
jgi:hypothetical protein